MVDLGFLQNILLHNEKRMENYNSKREDLEEEGGLILLLINFWRSPLFYYSRKQNWFSLTKSPKFDKETLFSDNAKPSVRLGRKVNGAWSD